MERVNAYLLGNGLFGFLLVGRIYISSWLVGQRHRRWALGDCYQDPPSEIPAITYPLVFYLLYFIFFSGICRCETNTSASLPHYTKSLLDNKRYRPVHASNQQPCYDLYLGVLTNWSTPPPKIIIIKHHSFVKQLHKTVIVFKNRTQKFSIFYFKIAKSCSGSGICLIHLGEGCYLQCSCGSSSFWLYKSPQQCDA